MKVPSNWVFIKEKQPQLAFKIFSFQTEPQEQFIDLDIQPTSKTKPRLSRLFSCICGKTCKKETPSFKCVNCELAMHRACMQQSVFQKPFYCPTCQLKYLDPNVKVLDILVKPWQETKSQVERGSQQDTETRQFELTEELFY